jgi:LEA14-like dessication related protein
MTKFRTMILICLFAGCAACAGIRPVPPEVQLSGLEITDLSLSHANFLARLLLYNPNGVSLDIKSLKFTLVLNGVRVADGQSAKPLTIPAEESGEVSIRLSSSYLNLLHLTRKLQDQEQIEFNIDGEVKVAGLGILTTTVPIEHQGTLPLAGTLNHLRSPRQSGPQP